MTKTQILSYIAEQSKLQCDNAKEVIAQINDMDCCDKRLLAKTLITVGSSITDTLNCIALILCEMMYKEE